MRQSAHLVAMLALVCSAPLTACGERAGPPGNPVAVAPSPPPTPPRPTKDEWLRAASSGYSASNFRDEGDGIKSFTAHFPKVESDQGLFAFAKRDDFNRSWVFKTAEPQMWWTLGDRGMLPAVILIECQFPLLVFGAQHFARDGLLYLDGVAVLVDGELVLERDGYAGKVVHEQYPAGVREAFTFGATSAEVDGLRKLTKASKVAVRLVGRNAYVTLKAPELKRFMEATPETIRVYDRLTTSLRPVMPAACTP